MRATVMFLLMFLTAGPALGSAINGADRAEVLRNSATLLEQRYVDPAVGRRLATALRHSGARWDGNDDPKLFAEALTQWLRRQSGDGHLGLTYSEAEIPEVGGDSVVAAAEMERWYGAQLNHGVEKIERLDGNVMLLDLRVFPPPEMAGDVISAAMNIVAQGDALIIDLRRNGGGSETNKLITGYLLDKVEQPLTGSYDRPTNTSRASTSPSWVPGRRFGGTKPLFILISKRTFSAAESLAYDLRALKRAVLVGERTGGGAHPYEYRRVHAHFAIDLPEAKSINPITGGNWQGIGVTPDIEVPADQALERALELARTEIAQRKAERRSPPTK